MALQSITEFNRYSFTLNFLVFVCLCLCLTTCICNCICLSRGGWGGWAKKCTTRISLDSVFYISDPRSDISPGTARLWKLNFVWFLVKTKWDQLLLRCVYVKVSNQLYIRSSRVKIDHLWYMIYIRPSPLGQLPFILNLKCFYFFEDYAPPPVG